jgi:pseudouridine synthase
MERLQKVLAEAGVASRRKAEEMILAGEVKVDGHVVAELGTKVDPASAVIEVNNRRVRLERKTYILLNKPRGYISDRDETGEHKSALDLAPQAERLFAAGRLDLDSEGLLLLTNDGDLTLRLTHPRYEHEKEYLALVSGAPDDAAIQKLLRGIVYQGERYQADRVARGARKQPFGQAGRDQSWLHIVLHEGRKRQIRHMFGAIGHPVLRLIRTRIGPLELDALKSGRWRALTAREIRQLFDSVGAGSPRPYHG